MHEMKSIFKKIWELFQAQGIENDFYAHILFNNIGLNVDITFNLLKNNNNNKN